jgi:hypothetical protein
MTESFASINLLSSSSIQPFKQFSPWMQNEASWNPPRMFNSNLNIKNDLPVPLYIYPRATIQTAWLDVQCKVNTHSITNVNSSNSYKRPLMAFISHQNPSMLVFASSSNDAVHCIDLCIDKSGPSLVSTATLLELFSFANSSLTIDEDNSAYSIVGLSDCLNGTFLIFCNKVNLERVFIPKILVVSINLKSAEWATDNVPSNTTTNINTNTPSGRLFNKLIEGDATKVAQALVGLILNEKVDGLQLEHFLFLFSTI